MLPGECVFEGMNHIICEGCGAVLPLRVMSTPAGYYVGYLGCQNWDCPCWGPSYSRETGYFKTHEQAEQCLQEMVSEGKSDHQRR